MRKTGITLAGVILLLVLTAGPALAQSLATPALPSPASLPDPAGTGAVSVGNVSLPALRLNLGPAASRQDQATSLQILLLLTVLSVAPAILVLMTAFTRVVVVLSFVRTSLGVQTLPPNAVLMGLALFLTFFIMAPTFRQVQQQAWTPYVEGRISQEQAFDTAMGPMKEFMLKQTRKQDLELMQQLAAEPKPAEAAQVSTLTLVPAFAISELRTAFQMGFMLFLPFVVIDLVVASTMMSMGMMMVPPALVSLPFKVLVFVLADGWHLVVRALAQSFS